MPHTGALPPIWNVPLRRNPNFTGREGLLTSLREALASGQPAAVTQAIHGLGGVGKTQLAVEYCYRHAGDYQVVWWVRAEEPASLGADFAALAAELGLPEAGEAEQARIVEAVRRCLEGRGRWLLVLDNAPDHESVTGCLPRSATGHAIITSRHATWGGVAKPLAVPIWPEWEAMEFLTRRTGEGNPELAADLAEALGYLPLALEQAAAYIEEVGACSMAAYLKLFRERHGRLLAKGHASTGYEDTVATTWAISFRALEQESKAGAALLNLCAFLAPDDIPLSLIAEHAAVLPEPLRKAASDRVALDEAVAAARRYSLAQVSEEALSMHRLVQWAARLRLTPAQQRKWAQAAVDLLNAAFHFEEDDLGTWGSSGLLAAHALAAADRAEEAKTAAETTSRVLNVLGRYLWQRAEFGQARAVLERAITLCEAAHGPDHPNVAACVNDLGRVLQVLGDLGDAKACCERALRIGEAALGPDHPTVASYVNNLGRVLLDMGDLAGARASFERALRIDEAVFGRDHPTVPICANNLGRVLHGLGDLAGAEACYGRALRIGEAVFGPEHPNVAIYVNNLGRVLQDMGDLAGAKECYERALRIHEAVYGPDHPDVATNVNNLGCVLHELGDLAGARLCYERALAILVRFLGGDHPRTRLVRGRLAALG